MISNIKFRKLLNDLKRRPEDAAKDLNITKKEILKFLNNKKEISYKILNKATKVWAVNHGDFFSFSDDTQNGFKIMRSDKSNKSKRIMIRGKKPYYLYKDTVMSKVSPFKPELITELVVVENDNPNNPKVKFNNGHFLHQFTYFIGPVNFYYLKNNKKKIAKMNTGDSMYIAPYIPHSFTTRKNKKNELGKILALTYSDQIDNETLNELNVLGFDIANKYRIDLTNKNKAFWENLDIFLNNSSITLNEFKKKTNIDLNKLRKKKNIPNLNILKKISNFLNIGLRDLLPPKEKIEVKIQKYSQNRNWYFPSNKKKDYLFVELTNIPQLPYSRGYEFHILSNHKINRTLEVPSHQYIYNIGHTNVQAVINKKKIKINPGDSLYIKPNLKHYFNQKGKLLILRLGGRISGDRLYQLSMLSKQNLFKTIDDIKPWFNK